MADFITLVCTTCRTRLKVRDQSAIGQIHACPKCGSMVHVTSPGETSPIAARASAVSTAIETPPSASPTPQPTEPSLEQPALADAPALLAPPAPVPSLFTQPWFAWACVPLSAVFSAWLVWTWSHSAAEPVIAELPEPPVVIESAPLPAPAQPAPAQPAPAAAVAAPLPVEPPKRVEPAPTPLPSALAAPVAPPLPPSSAPPPVPTPVSPSSPVSSSKLPASDSLPTVVKPPEANPPAPKPAASTTPAATTEGPQPVTSVALPELPPIDIPARLQDELASIQIPQASLYEFLALLSRATTLPISYDLATIERSGSRLSDPISVKKFNIKVEELLRSVLAERSLDFVVRNQQVLITTEGEHPTAPVTVRHALTGFPAEQAASLVELVQKIIAPQEWNDGGGAGKLTIEDQKLVAVQRAELQWEVAELLDKLRLARQQKPLAPHSTLTPRHARATAALQRGVQVNFPSAVSLGQVIDHLAKTQELLIVYDRAALTAAGRSPASTVSLVCQNKSLSAAFVSLLEPLGLELVVFDEQVLEITSQRAAAERLRVELYPWKADDDSESRLQALREQLAEVKWSDNGSQGTIAVDRHTPYLIVRHNQAVQRRVADWLAKHAPR